MHWRIVAHERALCPGDRSRHHDQLDGLGRGSDQPYLPRCTDPELAAPELHTPPQITAVWAVPANDGAAIDGCIPSGQGDRTVWITKGMGDYLNLRDHAWSKAASAELVCGGPGPEGTIVIDDANGTILGIFPENSAYPHPTP